ncbi:MAG TPA: c-type cytochrome [Tepidisphaeraceae bacterium]|nr:c-type cytochrome [Tepidisphaeraceae bacterium]
MKRSQSQFVSSRWLSACALIAMVPALAMSSKSPTSARPSASRTVWDSVYSVPQAARGESTYAKTCARCHGASLTGGDESPPLTGGAFLGNWNGLPLSDLQTRIKTTMPTDSVGIYDRQLITDVMAFLLKVNGFPAGQAALPADGDALKEITLQATKP